MAEWVRMGTVGKAHGLRGDFFVSGRDELVPKHYKVVRLGPQASSAPEHEICSLRNQSHRSVIRLSAFNSRTEIERFTGEQLWIPSKDIIVDEGEFLWDSLIGKEVFDKEHALLGKVHEVSNTGASDFLTITHPKMGKLSIPIVEEYFQMEFNEQTLKLVVAASLFSDLWQQK